MAGGWLLIPSALLYLVPNVSCLWAASIVSASSPTFHWLVCIDARLPEVVVSSGTILVSTLPTMLCHSLQRGVSEECLNLKALMWMSGETHILCVSVGEANFAGP